MDIEERRRDKEPLGLLASSKKPSKGSDTSVILEQTFSNPSHPLHSLCDLLSGLETPWTSFNNSFKFLTVFIHNKKFENEAPRKTNEQAQAEEIDMPALLEKYSYKKGSKNKREEESTNEPKSVEMKVVIMTPDDFENRFHEVSKEIIAISSMKSEMPRVVFAFLDVDRYYRTRYIRMANSQTTMLFEKIGDSENATPPKNVEEFSQFLADLQIIHGLDYRCFVSAMDLAEFLAASCKAINKEQSKKNLANVDLSGKASKTTQYSIFEGITNSYSKCWLAMLMAIPGISEQKAVSVVKRFPSIKSFMDHFGNPELTSKEAIKDLASSQITYLKNNGGSKNLGPGNAAKILTALTSFDPNQKI